MITLERWQLISRSKKAIAVGAAIFALTALAVVFTGLLLGKLGNQIETGPAEEAGDASQSEIKENKPLTAEVIEDCEVVIEEKTVRGSSLEPLVKSGSTVRVALDENQCLQIERNDIITYAYAGNPSAPVLKIIRGVPGDKFSLRASGGSWNILINGQVLKNSEGKPYETDSRGYNLLSLYVRDYKGVIPENVYLLLGDSPSGTTDSTRFGLVDRKDITGKVF